jgi:signal transduction histidine kinase
VKVASLTWRDDRVRQVALAIGAVACATVGRLALQPLLRERAVFLLFVIAVAVVSHFGGLLAGLVTLLLSCLSAGFLFLGLAGPHGMKSEAAVQMALFTIAALPISVLGGRLHAALEELKAVLEREHRWRTAERLSRTEAERANRLKDEFLAVLSHELRTPLNAIVGWSHALRNLAPSDEAQRAVDTILRNADRQVELLSEITDVSKSVTGKLTLEPALVDLRSPLELAIDVVRLSADARGIRLQMTAPEMPLVVRGDAGRLQQVFWNLLSNAIKFTESGGSVRASAGREGDRAVVTVSDTGQGISAEFLPFVFDSFRQEDPSKARRHGGLGLGLSIVRHLIEAHGGIVEAASEGSGKGATFTVRLPLAAGVTADIAPPDAGAPALTGMRIMIVDDDADSREIIGRALRQRGAEVRAAASADDARAAMANEPPDVIVSDLGMPGEDGLTFIRLLRRRPEYRQVPAIAVSAYSSITDRSEALDAGFQEHISKPAHPDNLARVIAATVRRPH